MQSEQVADGTEQLTHTTGYRVLVGVGLVSYGIVHLVLAWIALQVAFGGGGGGGGDASTQGALKQLAGQPFGAVLMWVMAVGLFTLVLWQGLEAAFGPQGEDLKDQVKDRGRAVGRALVYLALGVTAVRLAVGAGSGSQNTEQTVTARLLAVPFGRVLVVVVGLAVIAVGVSQIVKGVQQKFTRELRSGVSRPVRMLGLVGYVAKGVALVIVGLLFGYAAISYDADKAGGMDAALSTIRDQPFGTVLLAVMAAGIACFGLFCFVWAKNAKR